MVAKVISGKSIRGILHYNEDKVKAQEARLIMASGFGMEIHEMNFNHKLKRFENLTMLNGKVKTNALHISLNFDSTEKLTNEKMQQIAMTYMEMIGFGDQPYLVYRHMDAAHPHIHIATTNIQANGKRIDIHNIGRTLSETARKEIEERFQLVKAKGKRVTEAFGIKPADIEKAMYGKTPTKRAISNIVKAVARNYKFTSVAEFNAILRHFNVIAIRGREDTLMYQKKGLVYSLLDKEGQPVGIPIKASSIYGKPTLSSLEAKFKQNKEKRAVYKEPLKSTIEKIFNKYNSITKATFIEELNKKNINVMFRQNEQGFSYGVTFVDHRNKTVFNGSDLGKAYSAKALTERLSDTDQFKTYLKPIESAKSYLKQDKIPEKTYLQSTIITNYLKELLSNSHVDNTPMATRRKKKRRKGFTIK